MSSDDQATTEDRASELDSLARQPQWARELRYRLKQANKVMGRQGQTIANLRGELARTREDHSKIERGELRRLERFEEMAKDEFASYDEKLEHAGAEILRLREKLSGQPQDVPDNSVGAGKETQ